MVRFAQMNHPEQPLAQSSIDDMGVKEMLRLLRQYNADRNRGELNRRFMEWILESEEKYSKEISNIKMYGNIKNKFTYYGMIFTILKWEGCFVRGNGKQHAPNEITYNMFCGEKLLNLTDRLRSNNVRKTLATSFYSYNYSKDLFVEEKGGKINVNSKYYKLMPVFKMIAHEIRILEFI